MKLIQVFNQNYKSMLDVLMISFSDDVKLSTESKHVDGILQKNTMSVELHQEFALDTPQSVIDRIFDKDISLINEVGVLRRCNVNALIGRMRDDEQLVFWTNLQNTCRYSSMLRACGEQLSDMEQMAFEFMEANKNCAPEKFQGKLFQEMLSGGPMSKRLLSTFGDTKCIKNILSNIGNILKTDSSTQSGGQDVFSLFGDIMKENMSSNTNEGETEEDQAEQTSAMINDIQESMKNGSIDLAQLINTSMMG